MLLGSDETKGRVSEDELTGRYHLSVRSVKRIRKRFFEEGMDMFEQKARKTRPDKKIGGRVEAHLVALVCQGPPKGESRWKLQLLAVRWGQSGPEASASGRPADATMLRGLLPIIALLPSVGPKRRCAYPKE